MYTTAVLSLITLLSLSTAQSISNEPSGSQCGNNYYSQSQIDQAGQQALYYYGNGETVGNDNYPHQYNDYEGFSFNCGSPYIEFPIEESGAYSGGSPGADRVVLGSVASDGSSAVYCALITHTGASGNDFNECDDN